MWGRRRKDRSDCSDGDNCAVANEVEALLAGTYVRHLSACGQQVPAWAYLNEVAHAPRSVLRARVSAWEYARRVVGFGPEVSWRDAEAALASEVIAVADDDDAALSRLQREVLVPLELRLAGSPRAELTSPASLVGVARAALHSDPGAGPQPQAAP